MRHFTTSDFDFALPPELIAQHPAAERSGSRLLDGSGDVPIDCQFRDLPGLLRAGDLLASGTVSGPTPDAYGSLLELSWAIPLALALTAGIARVALERWTLLLRAPGR